MRVGTTCYATEQGLGVLARDFVRNGVVTDPWVLKHSHRPNRLEWYPGRPVLDTRLRSLQRDYPKLIRDVDAVLFFETPFWWPVIPYCRSKGVKTILMVMYECTPEELPNGCTPDLVLTPSALDQRYFPTGTRVTVPADPNLWRPRADTITTFVHNAGHGGLRGRNGTAELVEAWPMVSRDAKLILRSQERVPKEWASSLAACGNVRVMEGSFPHSELYREGECFVFPEKFNGLSLPLQEAFAAGMVVAATDRHPNREWLPRGPLIPSREAHRARVSPRMYEFDEAVVRPQDIAATLNALYGQPTAEYAVAGKEWGKANSWEVWGPKYRQILEQLVSS